MHVHPRGIVAVLGIVTLQQEVAGAAEASIAYTLAAIKDWTFWLGPGWVVGWGNGLILGYLMYSSGLVPRKMAVLGLIGGPLIILSGTLVMFGVADPGGPLQGIATIPEALWELLLGIYCTVKGFRPESPILRADARDGRVDPRPAVAPAELVFRSRREVGACRLPPLHSPGGEAGDEHTTRPSGSFLRLCQRVLA